jgi:hypothetical protein
MAVLKQLLTKALRWHDWNRFWGFYLWCCNRVTMISGKFVAQYQNSVIMNKICNCIWKANHKENEVIPFMCCWFSIVGMRSWGWICLPLQLREDIWLQLKRRGGSHWLGVGRGKGWTLQCTEQHSATRIVWPQMLVVLSWWAGEPLTWI